MLFEWEILQLPQLQRNRREQPSGGKPQTEVVWFGRFFLVFFLFKDEDVLYETIVYNFYTSDLGGDVFKFLNILLQSERKRPAPRVKKKDEKEVGGDLNEGTQGVGQEGIGTSKQKFFCWIQDETLGVLGIVCNTVNIMLKV